MIALANAYGLIALAIAVQQNPSLEKRLALLAVYLFLFVIFFLCRAWFLKQTFMVAVAIGGAALLVAGLVIFSHTAADSTYVVVDATKNSTPVFGQLRETVKTMALEQTGGGRTKVGLLVYGGDPNAPPSNCTASANLLAPRAFKDKGVALDDKLDPVTPGGPGSLAIALLNASDRMSSEHGHKKLIAVVVQPDIAECDRLDSPAALDLFKNRLAGAAVLIVSVGSLTRDECALLNAYANKLGGTYRTSTIPGLPQTARAFTSYGAGYFSTPSEGNSSSCK